jgi:hypothetical protein
MSLLCTRYVDHSSWNENVGNLDCDHGGCSILVPILHSLVGQFINKLTTQWTHIKNSISIAFLDLNALCRRMTQIPSFHRSVHVSEQFTGL